MFALRAPQLPAPAPTHPAPWRPPPKEVGEQLVCPRGGVPHRHTRIRCDFLTRVGALFSLLYILYSKKFFKKVIKKY